MSEHLSLTIIDRIKARVHAVVADYRQRLKGCHYIDVRLEVSEAKGGYAQNGTAKESYEDAELSMGIRVHAGESMIAPGYFGRVLGSPDVPLVHMTNTVFANGDRPPQEIISEVDDDFTLIPVPNCGKGQPMQSMQVGNGGPTMRRRAQILGGDVAGDEE